MWFTMCSWLNTNMMETRQILETSELDGFEKVRSSLSLGLVSQFGNVVVWVRSGRCGSLAAERMVRCGWWERRDDSRRQACRWRW
jgi:hypothetical protein